MQTLTPAATLAALAPWFLGPVHCDEVKRFRIWTTMLNGLYTGTYQIEPWFYDLRNQVSSGRPQQFDPVPAML